MNDQIKTNGHIQPDASVSYLSAIALFVPSSQKALAWLKENCVTEAWQWENDNLSVEWRSAEAIIQGMEAAGLVVVKEG
jgi:hypothetical protein